MDFRPLKIGKYLLLERLAMGGMAEVYRAKASGAGGFEKQLAIKRILPHYSQNEEFRRMFEYEARLSSMLTHANIVQVYDFVKSGETYLLALEYVDGKNLRQLVNKAKKAQVQLPPETGLFIINEVCKGLEYAHRKKDDITGRPLNIIHRDMSPQNVMIGYEGSVKIVDFGIAKAKDRVSETRSGVIKGKFGYMSPEQANGEMIDHRTDIFSTCIILYELLTNRRLFISDNDLSTLKMIQECVVPPPSRFNPKISADLEKIVLKGLSKDLSLRFQTAGELQKALQDVLNRNFPSYSSRELNDIMQKVFAEEIEQEKKRLEQLHRQSIPFSQQNTEVEEGTFSGIPQLNAPEAESETRGDEDEDKETLITLSEVGKNKTSISFIEDSQQKTEATPKPKSIEKPVAKKEISTPELELNFLNTNSPSTVPNTSEKSKSTLNDENATVANTRVSKPLNETSNPAVENTELAKDSTQKDFKAKPKEDTSKVEKNSFSKDMKDLQASASGLSLDFEPTPPAKASTSKPNSKTSSRRPLPEREPEVEEQTRSFTFTFFSIALLAGLSYGAYFAFKNYISGNKRALVAEDSKERNLSSSAQTKETFETGKKITGNCGVKVESDPPSAVVEINNEERGTTPITLLLDCQKSFSLTLKKTGYEVASQTLFTSESNSKVFKSLKEMPLGNLQLRLTQNAIVEVEEMGFRKEVKSKEEFSIPLRADTKMKVHFKNEVLGIDTYEEFIVPEKQTLSKTIILEAK